MRRPGLSRAYLLTAEAPKTEPFGLELAHASFCCILSSKSMEQERILFLKRSPEGVNIYRKVIQSATEGLDLGQLLTRGWVDLPGSQKMFIQS